MSEGKPMIFISYSHEDKSWKDMLVRYLSVLALDRQIELWDDTRIGVGEEWYDDIQAAMDRAQVAVALITVNSLASRFIREHEFPFLLEARREKGLWFVPVLVEPCPFESVHWLKQLQFFMYNDKSLIELDERIGLKQAMTELTNRIHAKVTALPASAIEAGLGPQPRTFRGGLAKEAPQSLFLLSDATPKWPPLLPEKVYTERLPQTGGALFGRNDELNLLDDAWESGRTNIAIFTAYGGVGKSTLVNKWLSQMALDHFRGAKSVYAWSFYSQGTGERITSADLFIDQALRWYGDEEPEKGSPWEKGRRLANLVREERALLILDGLEPLQSHRAEERGKLRDPALATLLTELASKNPGLCLITTRESVTDLARFKETVIEKDLETIGPEAGRALLRTRGILGTDQALEEATQNFGCHALALNLLGAYLHEIPGHPIARAGEIPDLDIPVEKGRHPRRLMAMREKQCQGKPEVDILRVLGLFDRPAERELVDAVKAPPVIEGLTDHLQGLTEIEWQAALKHLRQVGLLMSESTHNPDELDAHPLVREHFGEVLETHHEEAFKEGHRRLYEHLKASTKELPETLDEMAPLYAAVFHGCKAGMHQEALIEVYRARILRGDDFFSTNMLGTFGADLVAFSEFFIENWTEPVSGLTEPNKAFVQHQAGFRLRALGRLEEAAKLLQAGLEAYQLLKDWSKAATVAGSVSKLFLLYGRIEQALAIAKKSIVLADKSDDKFRQMFTRTTLAHVLHHGGQLKNAGCAFTEAEDMQRELQPQYPQLYSVQGYRYCELLLSLEQAGEVLDRSGKNLERSTSWGLGLLTIALDRLSLGRAHLMLADEAQPAHLIKAHLIKARSELELAVEGLRQAGHHEFITRSLLARAELFRTVGDYPAAHADLTEALSIAGPSGMRLHEADIHLALCRLSLAEGKRAEAVGHLDMGRKMVREMGYGRRAGEVAALEGLVDFSSPGRP